MRDRYGSTLHAAYDYYPYGMLMPGRYSQDTSQHCTTISFTEQVFHVNDGSAQKMPAMALSGGGANVTPTGSPAPTMSLTTIEGEDYLDMTTTAAATGAEYYIDGLLPDNTYEMSFNVAGLENEFTLSIVQTEDSIETLLGNVLINATGQYTLQVTPTVPQIVAKIIGNGSGSIFANGDDLNLHHKTPKTYTYTLCSRPRDNYRYGFNGKEKDNEIAGIGNSYDYGARRYDPRIGRPISIDPLRRKFPMLTPYQFFSNNPIWFTDLDGKEGIVYTISMWKNTNGETQISMSTAYDVNGDSSGVLYKVSNLDNNSYNEHYIADIEIKPSAFQNWMSLQKKALRNDWTGSIGYEAVGQHTLPAMANGLSMMIGVGEVRAAYKGIQGTKGLFRLGLVATDLTLTTDDFAKHAAALNETPLEMLLSEKGKEALLFLKLTMSSRSLTQGLENVGKEAENIGSNLYQTGKAAYDTKSGTEELVTDKRGNQKWKKGQ